MIPLTQNVHKGQHENDPSWVSGCLQLRVGAVARNRHEELVLIKMA